MFILHLPCSMLHILWRVYPLPGIDAVKTPAEANARNNRTSNARQQISKHASLTIEAVFSAWPVKSGYKEVFGSREWKVELRDASQPGYELGIEFSWQLQNNGMKGTRLSKEDFTCELKWQWDFYKSVERIRLVKVKTENPSACRTVNCSPVVPSCVNKVQ
jgi:hypothetical protein